MADAQQAAPGGVPSWLSTAWQDFLNSIGGGLPGISNDLFTGIGSGANSFFKTIGSQIGAGIESGFVYLLKDLWAVIVGPVEIISGAILAIAILIFIFREQLTDIAGSVLAAAV